MTGRNVQASTLALLRSLESKKSIPSLVAYQDTKDVWTIGHGATWYKTWGQRVKKGDKITAKGAEDLLKYHAEYFAKNAVNRYVKVRLTQNQFDSLLSLAFNHGEGWFKNSEVVRLVNKNPKNFNAISKELVNDENPNRRLIEAQNYNKVDALLQGISTLSVVLIALAGVAILKS